jgi:hypothetical protein
MLLLNRSSQQLNLCYAASKTSEGASSSYSDVDCYVFIRKSPDSLLNTHTLGTKITIREIPLNTQGIFFRKVAYPRYDMPSQMFQTGSKKKRAQKPDLHADYFTLNKTRNLNALTNISKVCRRLK